MASHLHLVSPPIQEAVIDIRVGMRPDFVVGDLGALKDDLGERFPSHEEMRFTSWELNAGLHGPNFREGESRIQGLLFRTAEPVRIAQCRVDGLTVSRLRPYTSFGELFDDFMFCWRAYESVVRPVAVTRIALRYINRFAIPAKAAVSEYLSIVPQTPVEGTILTGFVSQSSYRRVGRSAEVNFITALEPSVDGLESSIVVDIDCFQVSGFEMSEGSLAKNFGELRDLKNEIFRSSVTARSIEGFQR